MNTDSRNFFAKLTELDNKEYSPVVFWSWNNLLDRTELIRQIQEMHDKQLGGFIIHARTGLKTPYLGEEWFECVEACLKKARELELNVWIYDENGWPSGFVGGKLLENYDFRARFLTYKVNKNFDENAYAVYVCRNGMPVLVSGQILGVEEYHTIYLNVSPANTDILNPDVVDAFIKETHEKYFERFRDSFGRELVGFFTDEPQYYRNETPFTPLLEKDYFSRYGMDVREGLIYLFHDSPEGYLFKTRYYGLLAEYYNLNYYKKINDWCESHNCRLTGHSIEEHKLFMQMWGGAGVMPSYRYEQVPAIDWLGRFCSDEIAPKQIGSVVSQLDKKVSITETFACSGYNATPAELKAIGESQVFRGITTLCYHLMPYSVASQGKIDHPPIFGPQSNWWDKMPVFNRYFTDVGTIIGNTAEITDVAVLHPMHSIYLNYVREKDYDSVKTLEDSFGALNVFLRQNGILFHYIDETILKEFGSVDKGKLIVGTQSYRTLMIPLANSVDKSTKNIVDQFISCGGKILLWSGVPEYIEGERAKINWKSNVDFEKILADRFLQSHAINQNLALSARRSELGEFIFLSNTNLDEDAVGIFPGLSQNFVALDLVGKSFFSVSDNVKLAPTESLILYRHKNTCRPIIFNDSVDITTTLQLKAISDNFLVLDKISISYDGKHFSEFEPLQKTVEQLLRNDFKGRLYVKYTWMQNSVIENLKVVAERSKYISAKVNGTELSFYDTEFDTNFIEADVSGAAVLGVNELIYEIDYYQADGVHFALFDPLATESLRNNLAYQTEIENMYLKGRFSLGKNFELNPQSDHLPINDLQKNGYPFFFGEAIYEGVFDCAKAENALLNLTGNFLTAEITLNGYTFDLVLSNEAEVGRYLLNGKNSVTLKIRSSLRNLFGPHHLKDQVDPRSVSPQSFTFRGTWHNKTAPAYTHEYQSIPFGVCSLTLRRSV